MWRSVCVPSIQTKLASIQTSLVIISCKFDGNLRIATLAILGQLTRDIFRAINA